MTSNVIKSFFLFSFLFSLIKSVVSEIMKKWSFVSKSGKSSRLTPMSAKTYHKSFNQRAHVISNIKSVSIHKTSLHLASLRGVYIDTTNWFCICICICICKRKYNCNARQSNAMQVGNWLRRGVGLTICNSCRSCSLFILKKNKKKYKWTTTHEANTIATRSKYANASKSRELTPLGRYLPTCFALRCIADCR